VKRLIVAIACIVALTAAYVAQAQKGKLASLIQAGDRKAALDMIRSGADVNEAQPDGTRPIHWAVYRVDYELMEALLAKKAKADVRNELGATPLTEAVKLGDARLVKMLLDAGSGPEGANDDGQSALMLAIKNGDLTIVQMLVNAGANVNAVEKVQDQTPLMWAAAANQNAEEMVKLLISKGANIKARAKTTDWPAQMTSEPRAQYHTYGGLTPLMYAARNGCYYCVEALVGAGADVNTPNILEGITPLMIALDSSHNDVAKFLLDHGANPKVWDVYGRTPLYIAVDHKAAGGGGAGAGGGGRGGGAPGGGRGGAGAGAPGGGRGGAGAAPGAAPAAAGAGAPAGRGAGAAPAAGGAVAPALPGGNQAAAGGRGGAQAGGGRGGQGGGGGRGGGGGAVAAGGGVRPGPPVSSMEIINALLAAGADPNVALSARRPEAGSGGRFSDPMLSTGTTPLYRATMNTPPDMEVIRVLLEHGASPNIFDMGITPFLLAAGVEAGGLGGGGGRGGGAAAPAPVNTELLDLFLAHGADINTQVTGRLSYSMRLSRSANWPANEGLTALHNAVASGRTEMVKYLLDHGAKTDVADWSGRTPMDVAKGVAPKPVPANFGTANIPALAVAGDDTTTVAAGSNSAGGGRGGAAPRPASPEIQAMLQAAALKK
jgi:ankyrin repeat protein